MMARADHDRSPLDIEEKAQTGQRLQVKTIREEATYAYS